MAVSTLEERVKAVQSVTGTFRMERIAYFGMASVCAAIAVAAAVVSLLQPDTRQEGILLLTASSGGAALAMNRILKMWDRAMDLLAAKGDGDGR